jgi:subtilisin family serine protease
MLTCTSCTNEHSHRFGARLIPSAPARIALDAARCKLAVFGALVLLLPALIPGRARAQDSGPYQIELHARKFTPKAGLGPDLEERIVSTIKRAAQPAERAHVLVQLLSSVDDEDRRQLAEQGITLIEPISKTTWFAAVTAGGAKALKGTRNVRWADVINPNDKVSPAAKKSPILPYQRRSGNRIAYSVLFHKDVTAEEVVAFAKRIDARLEDFDASAFPVVRGAIVTLAAGNIGKLAGADVVASIEPVPPPNRDHNLLHAQPLSKVNSVQAAPYNLDGSGVTVGVWDVRGIVFAQHLDLTPRASVQPGQPGSTTPHAVHVAGTIAASGIHIANAKGMAPKAIIYSWNAAGDINEMITAGTLIQVSNHSYGPNIGWTRTGQGTWQFTDNQDQFGRYTHTSYKLDSIVLEKGLIVVQSAGNHRNDTGRRSSTRPRDCFQDSLGYASNCIGPRGAAKNVTTVGAMDGPGKIADFSSFGPTLDGRIKPDLMAQGVRLLSLGNSSPTAQRTMSGTSMAAPVVTGVIALVLQEAKKLGVPMSPAGMRALLIQSAQDVTGVTVDGITRAHPGPDYATGWGIVDAKAAVDLLRRSGLTMGTLAAAGPANAWTRPFRVQPGESEVRVTLAWSDEPGIHGLINDLDLSLTAPSGEIFTPWRLDPKNPKDAARRNGGRDSLNTVEQVSVLSPVAGIWTAKVSAEPGNLRGRTPPQFAVAGIPPQE